MFLECARREVYSRINNNNHIHAPTKKHEHLRRKFEGKFLEEELNWFS
jgi:hypothetical protein